MLKYLLFNIWSNVSSDYNLCILRLINSIVWNSNIKSGMCTHQGPKAVCRGKVGHGLSTYFYLKGKIDYDLLIYKLTLVSSVIPFVR